MKVPVEPAVEDCCDSGCSPCIFDVYEKQLQLYKKYLECGEENTELENGISQLEYTSFEVVKNVKICESYNFIAFKKTENDMKIWWKPGDHFLFKYSSGDKCCTRAYTPLRKKQDSNQQYDFSIILKIYENGLVSNHLSELLKGHITLWRGPYGSFEMTHNKYNRIIMIAQGTGIVTFISIIEEILGNENDITKIILYYCCSSNDNILFREDLYTFKAYWNFTYKIFVSRLVTGSSNKYEEPIVYHKLRLEDLDILKPFSKDQFLLCGSLEFMKSYEILLQNNFSVKNIVQF